MKGTIYAVIAEVVARFWAWRTLRTLRNQRRGKLIPARCAVPRWSAVTPPVASTGTAPVAGHQYSTS